MFEGIYLWDAKHGVPTDQSIKQAEQQRMLYGMATLLGKRNLTEPTTQFRQEYIADKLYALEEEKVHDNAQEEKAKRREGYTKYPFRKPENPEAEYTKEFDDYVAGLTQGG